MATVESGDRTGWQAVLVGVSEYDDVELGKRPAVRTSLFAMADLLSDPALGGWPVERIEVIENPASDGHLGVRLSELARAATGVFLLYYVGHGVLSEDAELHLTVTSTRRDYPEHTGLAWSRVRRALLNCPAPLRAVILDCCFAGRAIESLSGADGPDPADLTGVVGAYTLAATTRDATAHAPSSAGACTFFTGELRDLVREGIPGAGDWLTFERIFPVLRERLRAQGLPIPSQRGTNTAGRFPFAANVATAGRSGNRVQPDLPLAGPRPVLLATGAERGQARAFELLTDAERITSLIRAKAGEGLDPDRMQRWRAEYDRDKALARVAEVLAGVDPERALQIGDSLDDEYNGYEMGSIRSRAAAELAVADPDRAERIARSVSDRYDPAGALLGVARRLSAVDVERARRLYAEAERVVQSMTDEFWRMAGASKLAEALAAIDADWAEQIARSITSAGQRALVLGNVAVVLGRVDPDRAERIALSITDDAYRVMALAGLAAAVTDRERASRLVVHALPVARRIADDAGNDRSDDAVTLARVSRALVAIAPELARQLCSRAVLVAQANTDRTRRDQTLQWCIDYLAMVDAEQAWRAAGSISDRRSRASAQVVAAGGLVAADPELPRSRLDGRLYNDHDRVTALAAGAEALAGSDRDRAARLLTVAERITRLMDDDVEKVRALVRIAEVWQHISP